MVEFFGFRVYSGLGCFPLWMFGIVCVCVFFFFFWGGGGGQGKLEADSEAGMANFTLSDKKEKTKFGMKLDNIYKYTLTTEEKTALSQKNDQQRAELKMELGKTLAEYDFLFVGGRGGGTS